MQVLIPWGFVERCLACEAVVSRVDRDVSAFVWLGLVGVKKRAKPTF